MNTFNTFQFYIVDAYMVFSHKVYAYIFVGFNDKIRHIDTIVSFSSGVSAVSRLKN